jgi:hypothetical protein
MWIGGLALALVVGVLIIVWCLGRWPFIAVDLFLSRRRQSPVFRSLENMDADPDASDG